MKSDKPKYPETEEGQAAYDRFRELTRRIVNVPKEKIAGRDDGSVT